MASIPTPKYILEIGQVTKVKQHKSDNDGVNYSCDVLLGDSDNSLPNVPVASSRAGFVCIPEVEDQVLVGFIRGNLSMPVILGTLYNDKVKPPLYSPGEAVYVCPEYKKKESDYPKLEELKRLYMELPMHKMKFVVREEDIHYELEKDKYKFDLKLKEGIRLEVNKNNTSLAISKDGDITITAKDTKISINKEGEISIDAKQKVGIKTTADVNLESSGGNMKLTANKITLDGKQNIEIKGMNTKVEAQTSLELKGMTAKMEADTSLDLKGGATAKVEAGAVMTIKGAIVNIN